MRILIPVVVIVAALSGLVTMSILEGAIPEVDVHQVIAGDYNRRPVKVQGVLHSILKDTKPIEFEVSDKNVEGKILQVVVDDQRPDIFKVGNDVAVEGVYDPQAHRMKGTKIYTKCPSRYETSEEMQRGGSKGGYEKPVGAATTP